MPAVQPKAKMMPAYDELAIIRLSDASLTYQNNIRESKEEERPLEVLPISRLILRLVVPRPQLLHQRTLLIARVYLASTLRSSGMCWSKTLLAVFLISGLSHIVHDCSMLGGSELITLVE
jgi:hypothetical protein